MERTLNAIRIENLTVGYDGNILFKDYNLTLPGSGCVCFFGASGSGKTTLLRVIAGMKKPLAGSVSFEWQSEKPAPQDSVRIREERTAAAIACVFQEDRLIPWLTALENVAFVIRSKSPKTKKADETAGKCLEAVGLEDAAGQYPRQLSGGMKQRVNIARALAFDAPVILLDEPFKGLDDAIKEKIIRLFLDLKKERLILLVTHDKEDAAVLADRIVPIGGKQAIRQDLQDPDSSELP